MCVELAFVFGAKERQVFIGELKCRLSMTGSIVNLTLSLVNVDVGRDNSKVWPHV